MALREVGGTHIREEQIFRLKHMTRLVVSDLDNTLIDPKNRNDSRADALMNLIANRRTRFDFAIVTGNEAKLGIDWADGTNAPLFAENGGVVYDPSMPVLQRITQITPEDHIRFIKEIIAPKLEAFLESRFPGYGKSDKITMETYHRPEEVTMADFYGAITEFVASLPEYDSSRITTMHSDLVVDVVHVGANKSRAIPILEDRLGVKRINILGAGDACNDIGMFEEVLAGNGMIVVPSNHDELVGEFLSERERDVRVLRHGLPSTTCMLDIVGHLYRN